jgi:circadian clock protein KaiB
VTVDESATLRRFEERLADLGSADYVLTLFVTGASDMSVQAISNIRALCDTHLAGRYYLEVVDVRRDAALTSSRNVLAAPTLIREAPLPQRRLVGDLSDTTRVLAVLEIRVPVPVLIEPAAS